MTRGEQRRRKEEWENLFRERVGRNIRRMRLKNGLTGVELAMRTGLSVKTILSWEKYDHMPSVEDFFYFLAVTGWKVADLVKEHLEDETSDNQ